MWLYRIISSFFGIRKKNDLSEDLKNLTFQKIIILFLTLNIIFICIVLLITSIIIKS